MTESTKLMLSVFIGGACGSVALMLQRWLRNKSRAAFVAMTKRPFDHILWDSLDEKALAYETLRVMLAHPGFFFSSIDPTGGLYRRPKSAYLEYHSTL